MSPNIPHVRKLSKKLKKVLNGFRKTKKKTKIIKSLNTLLLLANVNYCSAYCSFSTKAIWTCI